MITQELVARINYLARKARYEGLTDEEKDEQQEVRRQYLNGIRQQLVDAMEGAGYAKKHATHCDCPDCKANH